MSLDPSDPVGQKFGHFKNERWLQWQFEKLKNWNKSNKSALRIDQF